MLSPNRSRAGVLVIHAGLVVFLGLAARSTPTAPTDR